MPAEAVLDAGSGAKPSSTSQRALAGRVMTTELRSISDADRIPVFHRPVPNCALAMPRPGLKRRKPNHPALRTRQRTGSHSSPRQELERKLANKPIGERPSDSDDSDKLVTNGPGGRRGRYIAKQEIYMSGGVALKDEPASHPRRARTRKSTTQTTKNLLARDQSKKQDAVNSASGMETQHHGLQSAKKAKGVDGGLVETSAAPPAAKPQSTMVRPSQPTPFKENSILGVIKPRKRQPSILRVTDDSTLDLTDGDMSLPDFESTPVNLSRSKAATSPAFASLSHNSTSKKRKLGVRDMVEPNILERATPVRESAADTREPQLPTIPLSALRTSGQKQRRRTTGEDDIMALPASSSSIESPKKTKSPFITKPSKQSKAPMSMSTEQLQSLMPTTRRKTTRQRTKATRDFDIADDSDDRHMPSDVAEEGDDSSFLPRKSRRTRPKEMFSKPGTTKTKAAATGKGQSRNPTKASTSTSAAITSTRMTTPLSRSAKNREAKSPSQQPSQNDKTSGISVARDKLSGGSRLRTTSSGTADKENQADLLESYSIGEEELAAPGRKGKDMAVKSKWDEIDAWDMDFEEVEIMTGSSSPMRR